MVDESLLRASFLAGLLALVSLLVSWYRKRDPLLDAIHTVGFSDPILSYFSFFRYNFDGIRMLKEGYEKAKPGLFKIAMHRGWMVLPAGTELVEDIRKAPDDLLSHHEPLEEFLQITYTLDFLNKDDFYHSDVIRSKLIRNMPTIFKDVYDELGPALDDAVPTVGDEWVKLPIVPTMQRVICRVTNRVFVGKPLCRNRDYQTLNLNFAINVVKFATIIRMFPKYLKPVVVRILSNLPSQFRQEREFIRPMFEERLAKMEDVDQGDWDERPVHQSVLFSFYILLIGDAQNDMLMWLMSEAKGIEKSLDGVARRMLTVNFAAIHTTSQTLIQVLYRLLANPEYIEPLRQDVEAAVAEEGWTKAGLDKMYKIDSFLRETQRLDGLASVQFLPLGASYHPLMCRAVVILNRLALRPFTFSNGVTIPPGTLVGAPLSAIHTDGEVYPNPDEFDGFRFVKLRECGGDGIASKHLAGTTSTVHLPYGHGRLACPGRFFATTEIKAFLAYIVVTYDLKLEEGKEVPRELCIASSRIPRDVDVLFRKRQR
ncbi:cytochrome P450 [Russula brevipes]|nr:cytochrome P450 [Russula brevipes]